MLRTSANCKYAPGFLSRTSANSSSDKLFGLPGTEIHRAHGTDTLLPNLSPSLARELWGQANASFHWMTQEGPSTNSTVTATVLVTKHSHVLTIPRAALYNRNSSNFVYKVVNGQLTEAPIEVGVMGVFRVEVTKGLSAKDVIAINALNGEPLSNNRKVATAE